MNIRTFTRLAAVPLAGLALSAAALGTAQAATPTSHGHLAETSHGHLASGISVKNYSAGAYSTELTITNHTGQTLYFDAEHTNLNNGDSSTHWGQQPLQTLNDGQSETVSGYTHDMSGLDMEVTYDLPNGEFAYFKVGNDLVGSNSIEEGVYSAWLVNGFNAPDKSTQDNNYTGSGNAPHGVHISATAEIDETSD